MEAIRRFGQFAGIFAVLVVFASFCGCAGLTGPTYGPGEMDTSSGERSVTGEQTPEPIYHDFEDVLIPLELVVDKKNSFVYHAPGFKAGIVSLSGRVEVNSLIRFFENQMAKDNWRLMSVFKAPRTIMFFNKPNRSCIIIISEKQFKTEVDVCVVPTMEEEEAALLK